MQSYFDIIKTLFEGPMYYGFLTYILVMSCLHRLVFSLKIAVTGGILLPQVATSADMIISISSSTSAHVSLRCLDLYSSRHCLWEFFIYCFMSIFMSRGGSSTTMFLSLALCLDVRRLLINYRGKPACPLLSSMGTVYSLAL